MWKWIGTCERMILPALAAGILTPNEEEAKKFISWGYTFVAVGADLGLLAKNADALAKRFKS